MNNLNGVEQKAPSTGDKPVEEFQKTQKTSNSILSKTGNVVMKGDVKPMAAQPTQMEKGFKVKISEIHEYSDLLNSLNSAFIRYESETSDKFKTLFDTRKDFLEHKNLFLHELAKLNKDCS